MLTEAFNHLVISVLVALFQEKLEKESLNLSRLLLWISPARNV